ncbi:hypothetical protein Egran_04767 [Elaphomyces granulatus]|uniref:Uncharacterized protein n=1 Tax=Elaphomyces granulatus TaxID=519963 RepID=A0A232LTM7_9EURO|nr:hypothetical protein Egran_04767 [Elaphomyces granulatus]
MATSFGVSAAVFAVFFFGEVPRVRKDILMKIPILGDYFNRTVLPEDNQHRPSLPSSSSLPSYSLSSPPPPSLVLDRVGAQALTQARARTQKRHCVLLSYFMALVGRPRYL